MKKISKIMILSLIFIISISQTAEHLENLQAQNLAEELKAFFLNCNDMTYQDCIHSWNQLYKKNSDLTFGQLCNAYKILENDPIFINAEENVMQNFFNSGEDDPVPNAAVISEVMKLQKTTVCLVCERLGLSDIASNKTMDLDEDTQKKCADIIYEAFEICSPGRSKDAIIKLDN